MVKIVKMKKEDLRPLYKFGMEYWEGLPYEDWLTMEYMRVSFKQPGLNFTAKDGKKVIGGIIVAADEVVPNWIRFLVVKKEYARRGVGRMLIEKVCSSLKKGESIFVDTGLTDKSAINFYKKCGFKNRGKINSFYGNYPGSPGYILEKNV